MICIEFWKGHCTKAFNKDTRANDFILFFESCKKPSKNGQEYVWKSMDFESELEKLGCDKQQESCWSLATNDYAHLIHLKNKFRSQWHIERQQQLKQHLEYTLKYISPLPLDITVEQRLALVREFVLNHETDIGSVPFIRGLTGFLKQQLQHKHYLVEWRMSEYVLTQNDEDAMDAYVRLLRGVLGLQLVYLDDDQEKTVIQMAQQEEQESTLVWRMGSSFDIVQQASRCFSKYQSSASLNEYIVTDIPRNASEDYKHLIEWIYALLSQCLAFLQK